MRIGKSRAMYQHGQDIATVNHNLKQAGNFMQEYGKIKINRQNVFRH